jgi:KDO2-lipid IV(A) lauroyltransferase
VERGRRKWVRHNLSNSIVYGGLFHGATRLPMPVLLAINAIGNSIAVTALRSTMADLADNFEKALGVPPREARRLARAQFFSYGRATIDVWRSRSGRADLTPAISSRDEDRARLFAARGESGKKGFLLVSAHVGNWEMGAVALRSHGLVPAVLGQPELDPDVQRMRRAIREQLGVESIDVGSSMATALRVRSAVERGSVVALVADRAYEDDHVVVPFFGRATRFLRSPALLARFCGCPILPGVYVRNADGSYRSLWGDLLFADPAADPDDDALRLMGSVASFVESAVRETPAQWYNFYRYWGDGAGSTQLS